jgi:hypothetical protein
VLDVRYLFYQLTPRPLDDVYSGQRLASLLSSANFKFFQSMNATSDKVPTSGFASGHSPSSEVTAIRWFARIVGVLWGGFFLIMFIGEGLQSRHPGSILHANPLDAAFVVMAVLYSGGLLAALKWERKGALLSLGALVGLQLVAGLKTFLAHHGLAAALFGLPGGMFNIGFLLFWLPVVLYLVCANIEAKARKRGKV